MSTAEELEKALKNYIACQFYCAEKKKKKRTPLFVTISREAGAGGITIGKHLAAYLKKHDKLSTCPWTVFDDNLVKQVLQEHELPSRFAKFLKEDKVSEIEDTMEDLFKIHPSTWTLVHKTSETILHLAQMGSSIIVGRGANIITRNLSGGLHVRLVGSMSKRLPHIEEYYGLGPKKAKEFIRKEDRGRANYLKKYFSKNIGDLLSYDLVINTDHIPYEEVAEMIGDVVLNRLRKA